MFFFDPNKPKIEDLLSKKDITFDDILFFEDITYHLKYEKGLQK